MAAVLLHHGLFLCESVMAAADGHWHDPSPDGDNISCVFGREKRFEMRKTGFYFKKYWFAYLMALLGLLIYEGLDMVSPMVTKSIIDDVITDGKTELLAGLLGLLLAVGIGRIIGGYLREFTFDKVSFRIGSDIRKDIFRHIQGLSIDYFDRTNTGEIMARVKDDVDNLQSIFGFIGMLMIQIIVHTVMIIGCMWKLSPVLTIFPLIALPLCGAVAIIMEKKLDSVYDEISEENAKMNTVAEENLAGVRTVKAFAREKFEITKFLGHNKKYYELNMKQSKVWIKYDPFFELMTKLLPLVSLLVGGVMVIRGSITIGTLGAFIEYCANAVWPMSMLGWISNEFASSLASRKKLKKIYAEIPTIKDVDAENREIRGRVTFENVSLKIGDKKILEGINFDLEAGKTLGIMGATGAGKTSIINMLLRFYDPGTGSVKLDGTDVRELPLKTVRKSTSAVMQDVFLFSDTISENVRMGRKADMTADEISSALGMACASEFVSGLEDKEETLIGERGVGLSGGQKQRISMARAFAKKAPILVLDDSTSALDMETEHAVQKNLLAMGEATKIIIAHRISAVRHADEIIVLKDGAVLERGTHETLLAQKGYYYDTYMAQYGNANIAVQA